jgi:hypothetical protein
MNTPDGYQRVQLNRTLKCPNIVLETVYQIHMLFHLFSLIIPVPDHAGYDKAVSDNVC